MKLGSYMDGYHRTHIFGRDFGRVVGKTIFLGFGAFNLLLGFFCIPYSILAAFIGIVGGIGLLLYALIYFRKI